MSKVPSSLPSRMLIHPCLLPAYMAHLCPAAPCYFGATARPGKFCRPTPHSHPSPQACGLPEVEVQGKREGPTRGTHTHLCSLDTLSSDHSGNKFPVFQGSPSAQTFSFQTLWLRPNSSQSSEGFHNTRHNPQKCSSSRFAVYPVTLFPYLRQ